MADKRIVTVDYLNSEGLNKDYISNTFANALKGSKSGSAFLIDDVSPVTHDMGVKVRGKNLLDINQAVNSTYDNAYDTFSINDNVIIATSDNSTTKTVSMGLFDGELPAGDYILSLNAVIENTPKHNRPNEIFIFKNGSVLTLNNTMKTDGTYSPTKKFTLSEKANIKINFYKSVNTSEETVSDTVYKVTFSNIQLELGTTATAYTPYVPDLTAVKVNTYGKNFIDINSIANDIVKKNPTFCEITEFDGKRCLKIGAISSGITYTVPTSIPLYGLQLKVYDTGYNKSFMSVTRNDTGSSKLYISTSTSNEWETVTRYYTYDTQYFTGMQFYKSDVTKPIYIDLDSVMLEASRTATEYEPYKGSEYTPSADGTVNGVTSLYPNTTLTTDTEGVLIDCEYNRDINKAFAALEAAIATNNS